MGVMETAYSYESKQKAPFNISKRLMTWEGYRTGEMWSKQQRWGIWFKWINISSSHQRMKYILDMISINQSVIIQIKIHSTNQDDLSIEKKYLILDQSEICQR